MRFNVILTNEGEVDGFNSLHKKGIKTYHFPMIKTSMNNIKNHFSLDDYEYYIFTSKNGIKYFFKNKFIKSESLSNLKVICIGSKTELALKRLNIKPVFTAKRNYSHLMLDELKKINILNNKRVMLIQGNLAKNYLFENLKMFCYLTKFVAYNTELINVVNRELEELLNKEKTYSVFTSSSGFLSFDQLYDAKKTSIISIGNSTSSFIKERGYEPMVTSKMQSYEGISDTIISYLIKD
ncbi:MAG: hypothetical protein CL870_03420 [Cytophagia bacterium]|nr:hypothetical protein [Cytophagia bacterium]